MKKLLTAAIVISSLAFTGCDRVAPNEIGVVVTNYGKDVNKDYAVATGRVWTMSPGTDLYTLPIYEQRNAVDSAITNKAADGTEFLVKPRYSYKIDSAQATTVVRQYSKIIKSEGVASLAAVEESALVPAITDIVRDVIQGTTSEDLMRSGGNAKFNEEVRKRVKEEFQRRGFVLLSFSTILEYSAAVKKDIDSRNQAKSQVATLDSQIERAKKERELAEIQAETRKTTFNAVTDQELKKLAIEKWDGKLPSTSLTGDVPVFLKP